MDGVKAVSCGNVTTLVVKNDGSLWACGGNASYLDTSISGIPFKENGNIMTPIKVMDGVASAYCGNICSAAVKTDGSLWMWGYNRFGDLGNGLEGNYREPITSRTGQDPLGEYIYQTMPVKVLDNVAAVSYGISDNSSFTNEGSYTTALKTDGSLWVWGEVEHLNTKPAGTVTVPLRGMIAPKYIAIMPVPTKAMDGVSAIAGGGKYIVKNDGSLVSLEEEIGWAKNVSVKIPGSGSSSAGQTTPPPAPSTIGGFTDVKESDYFANPVLWAVEKGITSGTSAATFSPEDTCSNAQILTFLWRANGSPEPTRENPFADVKPADYYYKAALWAAENGIVSGSSFGADTDCTRAMTVEYLWKAAGSPAPSGKASFTDVSASAEYAQAVAWAVEHEITSGTGDGQFSPADTCTRGQIMTFLSRALGQ